MIFLLDPAADPAVAGIFDQAIGDVRCAEDRDDADDLPDISLPCRRAKHIPFVIMEFTVTENMHAKLHGEDFGDIDEEYLDETVRHVDRIRQHAQKQEERIFKILLIKPDSSVKTRRAAENTNGAKKEIRLLAQKATNRKIAQTAAISSTDDHSVERRRSRI